MRKRRNGFWRRGLCDFCGTARAFLADAAFANRLQAGKPYLPCQSCNKCIAAVLKEGAFLRLQQAGNEAFDIKEERLQPERNVSSSAALPGMEAAKKSAERGFVPTLLCREGNLAVSCGWQHTSKKGLLDYIAYAETTQPLRAGRYRLTRQTTARFY